MIVLQAILLREVLLKTVKYKRLATTIKPNSNVEELLWLRRGSPIPEFTAPLANTTGSLTNAQLKDRPAILLFLSTLEDSGVYQMLAPAVHTLWHKMEGQLFVICRGTADSCRRLVKEHLFTECTENISVALDSDGEITASFKVQRTPQAIELDAHSRVLRYGQPEPSSMMTHEGSNGHHHHNEPTSARQDISSVSTPKEDSPPKVATRTIRHSR